MNTMRHYRRFLLLLAMLSAATSEMAQTDSLKDCNVFANGNRDIVYLLPSKEICETGEDLWFKAYLMDKQTLALSDKSQTLYLQVRNEKGEVIWSEKYPLMAGRGDGHIYIGENWQQGEYYMEGYTRSSFTADSTTNTHPRRIRVVERVTQMDSISAETVKSDSIQRLTAKHRFDLFPEGGHLVDGINCVMAFKATYGKGFPDDVTGKVLEDGKEIASFISVHDGMGKFALTPRQGKDYKVVLTDGRTYSLPAIERTGMALRVLRNNNTSVTMLVSSSDSLPHPFTVFAKQRGVPCCSARGIVKGQQIVRLPIDRFPLQGITEITLSDENDYPVAERLVYVNPTQQLNITVSTDRQQYNRRDEGKVCLKVTDSSGLPLKAELAVSIFDKAYLYLPGHENILSHCHLSEEIRGNIFNPTYYFDERNEDRLQALDLLLMTQGWRSYVWNEKPIKGRQVLTDGLYGCKAISYSVMRIESLNNVSQIIMTCLLLYIFSKGFSALSFTSATYFLIGTIMRYSRISLINVCKPSLLAILTFAILIIEAQNLKASTITGIIIVYMSMNSFLTLFRHSGDTVRNSLQFCGRNSLSLYLFSPMFTILCKPMAPMLSFDPTGILFLLLALVVCTSGSLLVASIMDKTGMARLMFGKEIYAGY